MTNTKRRLVAIMRQQRNESETGNPVISGHTAMYTGGRLRQLTREEKLDVVRLTNLIETAT